MRRALGLPTGLLARLPREIARACTILRAGVLRLGVMDLQAWVTEEHRATLERFDRSIAGVVPRDRWLDGAGDGGSSIAFLAFHTSYHEDVAVNAVLGAGDPVIAERRSWLGLDAFAPSAGLAEAEDRVLSGALDLDQLDAYVRAVHDRTAAWLASSFTSTLDRTPDSAAGLLAAGIAESDVPWLFAMWRGQPVSWFVQWEAIGHRINHLGEMVSVRNRLGLSPF